MMIKLRLLMLLGLLFLGSVAFGQYDGETIAALVAELERTDLVIEQATEAVLESGSLRAKNLLEAAISLQTRARNVTRSLDDHVYGQAAGQQIGKYTLSAREKAQRAIAITRQADENEDFVRRQMEKTEEMIKRIEEQTDSGVPENVHMVLESAREKQQRSRELFRNRRLKMALQMSLQTRKSLEKLVEQVNGYLKAQKHQRTLQERYITLLDRIEQSGLVEQAEVKNRLRQAEEHRLRSGQSAEDKQFVQAEKAMQKAVETLSRVMERIKDPKRIESSLENLRYQAGEMGTRLEGSGNQEALRLHVNAREHLRKAAAHYQDGDFEAAAVQLQAARQILSRISKILGE